MDDLSSAYISNCERYYYGNTDWIKAWYLIWKLNVSMDYEYIILRGSDYAYPEEMEILKVVLRKWNMSIIG